MIKFKAFIYCIVILNIVVSISSCKSEQVEIDNIISEAKYHFQKHEINKAIYLMETFVDKYPNRFEGYLLLLGFKYTSYDAPKNIYDLSKTEKKEFEELVLLSKRAVTLFENLNDNDKEIYLYKLGYFSFFLFIGNMYYEYEMYEEAIEFFDKYYDIELYISLILHLSFILPNMQMH